MPHRRVDEPFDPIQTLDEIKAYCQRSSSRYGTSLAMKPPNRIKFHWPPHPTSYEYHVLTTDWTKSVMFEVEGETFLIDVAETPFGVFGKSEDLWCEARGSSLDDMLNNLQGVVAPLFSRQKSIANCLEKSGRYVESISELNGSDRLKLLYCEDRDIAHEAHQHIEMSHYRNLYFPSLCHILLDRTHPWRRSAQWCVLDLFEDLPSFTDSETDEHFGVNAMKQLLWDAEDDYARTVYKAGVVLGGHLPHRFGGEALLECLNSPSLVGRRSAIHGLFHVCEWVREMDTRVIKALREHAKREDNRQLSAFAFAIANDIERGGVDHTLEPIFEFEN